MIASGGQYAIEHNIQRLEDDHIHAKILAAGLSEIAGVEVDMDVETNMVFFDVKGISRDELTQGLRDEFNVFVASKFGMMLFSCEGGGISYVFSLGGLWVLRKSGCV